MMLSRKVRMWLKRASSKNTHNSLSNASCSTVEDANVIAPLDLFAILGLQQNVAQPGDSTVQARMLRHACGHASKGWHCSTVDAGRFPGVIRVDSVPKCSNQCR
eukprot:NODE_1100_length_1100_cov_228.497621_g846_i0.p1 GENE.NODE_1100_length_1100_cov_228.497621_g846_i0~~NODE_1100_length_1100_cov_228.497621_g846_i0.p1  ORF type:complete len:117 (+),score=18.73 NODE_1100_length_1100_cov_228.497621_g846_i0:42-353(+)